MSTIAERVAAGAALLDQRDPDWWRAIRPADLDIGSCCSCVLGQLFGDYDVGMAEVGITEDEDADLGFNIYRPTDIAALNAEWKRVITERRSA
jgi:hypothetical protein